MYSVSFALASVYAVSTTLLSGSLAIATYAAVDCLMSSGMMLYIPASDDPYLDKSDYAVSTAWLATVVALSATVFADDFNVSFSFSYLVF
jgi:hypothetical protein